MIAFLCLVLAININPISTNIIPINFFNSTGGQWNGDLAISAIEDDSITKIDYTDTIPIRFINPETDKAIGLQSKESCTTGRRITWQTQNGGEGQTFYIKRTIDESNKWEIHSKLCSGMIFGIYGCAAGSTIQLVSSTDEDATDARRQWKITNGKIESSMCEGMVMEASTAVPQDPFPHKDTLKAAVRSYITEGCAVNSDCAIGKIWGYPMNIWNVGEITDFSQLFNGNPSFPVEDPGDAKMQTFNENIVSWDTSRVCNCNVCVCISSI